MYFYESVEFETRQKTTRSKKSRQIGQSIFQKLQFNF